METRVSGKASTLFVLNVGHKFYIVSSIIQHEFIQHLQYGTWREHNFLNICEPTNPISVLTADSSNLRLKLVNFLGSRKGYNNIYMDEGYMYG